MLAEESTRSWMTLMSVVCLLFQSYCVQQLFLNDDDDGDDDEQLLFLLWRGGVGCDKASIIYFAKLLGPT